MIGFDSLNTAPKISVLMGVYNCRDTIKESIDSIINQTFTDWELVICDDGSTDDTVSLVEEYKEVLGDKLVIIKHQKNMGLNCTLNDCLNVAKGEFVARMDGDDISLPNRFERELLEFQKEPDISVVSCPMIYFDEENGDYYCGRVHNVYPNKKNLVYGTVHSHAPCMVKTDVMRAVGGYTVDKKLLRVEDWNLWLKVYAAGYKGKNIPDLLYKMRDDKNAKKRRKFQNRLNEAYMTYLVVKTFNFPFYMYFYMLRPIIVGLLPGFLYRFLHRRAMSKPNN